MELIRSVFLRQRDQPFVLRDIIGGGKSNFRSSMASFIFCISCSDNPVVTFWYSPAFLAISHRLARNLVFQPIPLLLGYFFVSYSQICISCIFNSFYVHIDSVFTALRHFLELQQLMYFIVHSLEVGS